MDVKSGHNVIIFIFQEYFWSPSNSTLLSIPIGKNNDSQFGVVFKKKFWMRLMTLNDQPAMS